MLHGLIPSAAEPFGRAHRDGQLDQHFVEIEDCATVSRRILEDIYNSREADLMPALDTLKPTPMGLRNAEELDFPVLSGSAPCPEI